MKYFIILQTVLLLPFMLACTTGNYRPASIDLDKGWRFSTGDDSLWASSGFDDSGWDSIAVRQPWEIQGYTDYDGYAWYRKKVTVPSSMKQDRYLDDSVQISLGKIDDGDQFYLNGKFIGQNNKKYHKRPSDSVFKTEAGYYMIDRKYSVSVQDILWDKENVLAVRVFDMAGAGGMSNGLPVVDMLDIEDYLVIDTRIQPYRFDGDRLSNRFKVKNTSGYLELKGNLKVSVKYDGTGKEIVLKNESLHLIPGQYIDVSVLFTALQEPGKIVFSFKPDHSRLIFTKSDEVPYILTPKPADMPKINGAKVFGARPGSPFLFCIPATGLRPMTFDAEGLPEGLMLDSNSGIISGRATKKGDYKVILKAKNSKGEYSRDLLIKIGDQIMLTPPLGWNSWNCWGESVDEDKVLQSAKAFVEKGLQQHGWTFINIDGGWQGERDKKGNMVPNRKFPDMKSLGDSLHEMGLKFGIYSSPGVWDCGTGLGSYQHEAQDARSYASWGVDYLKYDWCTYSNVAKDQSIPELKKPYLIMRDALHSTGRDIVYSLCQYGMGNVWEWGRDVGGNLWRTTWDIVDTWESLYQIGFSQTTNAPYAGPGHWNDPDMLVVGMVGWGPNLHPTRLTVSEQYTHISLWSLLSAPLLIGCDLAQLDDFTLSLLSNDEVLAINQDPLGKQAIPVYTKGNIQIWEKELEDGTTAIGVFNLGNTPENVTVPFAQIGLSGSQRVRDVWKQKDLGESGNGFDTKVFSHGVVLLKLSGK